MEAWPEKIDLLQLRAVNFHRGLLNGKNLWNKYFLVKTILPSKVTIE